VGRDSSPSATPLPPLPPRDEGLVDVATEIGREDHDAFQILEPLVQVVSLDVGVAVLRIPDIGALARQRAGLVEKLDPLGR
jgi:hypothetical protein